MESVFGLAGSFGRTFAKNGKQIDKHEASVSMPLLLSPCCFPYCPCGCRAIPTGDVVCVMVSYFSRLVNVTRRMINHRVAWPGKRAQSEHRAQKAG